MTGVSGDFLRANGGDGQSEKLVGPVLELRNISKHFGGVRALNSVSLQLRAGEVVGLVGDNGAGKSTLVNIVSGTLQGDEGEVVVDGVARNFESAADARAVGIETVFQMLSLIPTLDITENIFLNRELYGPGRMLQLCRRMNKRDMRNKVMAGFEALGLKLPDPRTKVGALSGGQRQAVAIARAVLWGRHIVLLDEPAAALGVRQTEIVLSFIERLRLHGIATLFISHNMQHVLRVADRVAVMYLGEKVLDVERSKTTAEELVACITGAFASSDGVTADA